MHTVKLTYIKNNIFKFFIHYSYVSDDFIVIANDFSQTFFVAVKIK